MPRLLYPYDAFLSHAVEDNNLIANELCERLKKAGLKIWYSGSELVPGEDITQQVHIGLNNSRYGIFILSHNFMEKEWPKREYFILLSRERKKEKIIFPILYKIKPEELISVDPTLIDRYGIDAEKGMDAIVDKLTSVIKNNKATRRKTGISWMALASILIGLAYFLIRVGDRDKVPSQEFIENAVRARAAALETNLNNEHQLVRSPGATSVSAQEVLQLVEEFKHQKSHYRNEYHLISGSTAIKSRKNVEKYLGIDPAVILPGSRYVCHDAFETSRTSDRVRELTYAITNTAPVTWHISTSEGNSDIIVTYTDVFRFGHVLLTFASSQKDTRHNNVILYSLPKEEHLRFVPYRDSWIIEEIK